MRNKGAKLKKPRGRGDQEIDDIILCFRGKQNMHRTRSDRLVLGENENSDAERPTHTCSRPSDPSIMAVHQTEKKDPILTINEKC